MDLLTDFVTPFILLYSADIAWLAPSIADWRSDHRQFTAFTNSSHRPKIHFIHRQPTKIYRQFTSTTWYRTFAMASRRRLRDQPRPLTVLVDMDGVLADFEGRWLEIFRERYPDEPFIKLEDRRTFYIDDQYEDRYKTMSIIGANGFYGSLPPIEGACEAVQEMAQMDNVNVFLCSSPLVSNFEACAAEKADWIARHLGRHWLRRLILTCDKTLVQGHVLIDDKHWITGTRVPMWEHVLFTACHNKHIDLKGRERLDGWLPHQNWKAMIERFKLKYVPESR